MSSAPLPGLASWYTAGRSDGFGDRLLMFDNSDAPSLELLRFRPELAAEPGFEDLLRQRVQRLATFEHPAFASVRAVQHIEGGEGLALVSTHTPGRRLAELLDARRSPMGLHPAFVTWLVQQVTPLLADLQGHGYDIVHGALTAERIVLGPGGQVSIIEHVLGSALRGLELSPARLWRDFGIVARPTSRGEACLDARGDVMQLGAIALSLLLGRRVSSLAVQEQLPALLEETDRLPVAKGSVFMPPLRRWIERALQLHPQAFRSALEALDGTRELPAQAVASVPAQLAALMPAGVTETSTGDAPHDIPLPAVEATQSAPAPEHQAAHEAVAQQPAREDAREPLADLVGEWTSEADVVAPAPAVAAAAVAEPVLLPVIAPPAAPIERTEARMLERPSAPDPAPRPSPFALDMDAVPPPRRPIRWLVPALAAVVVAEAVVIGWLVNRDTPKAATAAAAAAPLAVMVETAQPGAEVFVDEQAAGTTPVRITLDSATRSLRVGAAASAQAALPAVVPPPGNEATAAALAQAAARQRAGGVRLSAPIEVQVLEGNRVLGTSADGPIVASAGTHQFDVVNAALGFRVRQSVTIRAGEITTLTITPPMGRLSVNAQPWAQVLVDQAAVGETPIANLAVPLGQHEIVFRHPQLGERRETVVVRADGVTRVSTTFGR